MKKVILPGLVAGLIMLILGTAVSYLLMLPFRSVAAEYTNTNLFRPWTDPAMYYMFVHPFIVGIILAWVWNKVKGVVGGAGWAGHGLRFGLAYWVVTIPGMLISYSSFQISATMVAIWSVTILVQALCAGMVYAGMNK